MNSFRQTSRFRKIFRIESYESEEDEWTALEKRLQQEGLNNSLSVEGKLIYVWRWLVDAENNLKTTRKMLDKLQMKHNQEMEEVEFFVEKLKDITDQRVAKVEEEKQQIVNKLQNLKDSTAESTIFEISEMLKQEGLDEIALSPISEQIAYLLVERSRLIEEISVERRKRKTANLTDNVKLSSTQMQQLLDEKKADYEEEVKFQQELAKQIKEQMKKYHEDEMRQIQKNLRQTQKKVEELNSENSNGDVKEILQKKCKELEDRVTEMNDRLKVMKKAMRELENENENLIYKLSEAMAECDEQEMLLRKMRMNSVLENSSNQRSPSLDVLSPLISPSSESSEQVQQNVEKESSSSQQKTISSEEAEVLRDNMKQLEDQLIKANEKYEYIITKYQHQRINQKSKLQKIRDKYHKNSTSMKEQIKKLEREINIANVALNKEKLHRTKVIQDLQTLQSENKTLYERILEQEDMISEKTRELSLLTAKTRHLEEKNSSLLQQLSMLNKRNSLQSLMFDNYSESYRKKTFGDHDNSLDVPTEFNTPLQESTKIIEQLSSVLSVVQLSIDKQDEIDNNVHKPKEVPSQIDSGIENLSLQTEKQNRLTQSHYSQSTVNSEEHPYQSNNLFLVTALQESHKLQSSRRHSQNDIKYWETSSSTPYSSVCQELPKTWPSSAISSPINESVPIQNKFSENIGQKLETFVDVSLSH